MMKAERGRCTHNRKSNDKFPLPLPDFWEGDGGESGSRQKTTVAQRWGSCVEQGQSSFFGFCEQSGKVKHADPS